MANTIIIDAADSALGRVASFAAKKSLLGNNIIIVNCDKVIITGNKRMVIDEFSHAARRGGHSLKGPFVPRKNTERIVKRVIRGMLTYRQQRGEDAMNRIMCYPAVPAEYQSAEKVKLTKKLKTTAISLAELSKEL